jgi:hypothetical protein
MLKFDDDRDPSYEEFQLEGGQLVEIQDTSCIKQMPHISVRMFAITSICGFLPNRLRAMAPYQLNSVGWLFLDGHPSKLTE